MELFAEDLGGFDLFGEVLGEEEFVDCGDDFTRDLMKGVVRMTDSWGKRWGRWLVLGFGDRSAAL